MNGQKRVDDNASLFNGSFQVVPPTIRHNLFNGHSNCRIKVVQTHCLGHLTFTLPKNELICTKNGGMGLSENKDILTKGLTRTTTKLTSVS